MGHNIDPNIEGENFSIALLQEPWPDDAELFQPLESIQVLFPDKANCLAFQAFLKMCILNYEIVYKTDVEELSPSGTIPYVKCRSFLVGELESLVRFVAFKGITLTAQLDSVQKHEMNVFISLINYVFRNAELYISWYDRETFNEVTKPRYGSVHPYPLDMILTWQKRFKVLASLGELGWLNKTLDDVYDEVEALCYLLSEYLKDQTYFFGNKPTELDAMVFGHVSSMLVTTLPSNRLSDIILRYPRLIHHSQTIQLEYEILL